MPLSDSTLFADRTMLRSIFIALDAMALLSDACFLYSAPDLTSMRPRLKELNDIPYINCIWLTPVCCAPSF